MIKHFQIGSDDNDLTLETINSLPEISELPIDAEAFTDDAGEYWAIANELGYRTLYSESEESVYLIK